MTWDGPRAPIHQWLTNAGIDHDNLDRPGYGTPQRPSTSGATTLAFTPEFGVTHYPVGIDDIGFDSMLHLLANQGNAHAPWPIYQAYIDHATARITLITEGRANHAGNGNSQQRSRALADLEPIDPPRFDDIALNRYTIGLTLEGPPTTPEQFESAARFWAAVCVGAGWSHNRILGHEETTYRKSDPDFDMRLLRARVAELLEETMAEPQFTEEEAADLRKLLTRHNDRFVLGEVVEEVVAKESSGKGIVTAILTLWRDRPWADLVGRHEAEHAPPDALRRGDTVQLD